MDCEKSPLIEYIPVIEDNYRLFTQFDKPYWVPMRRVLLSHIEVDRSLMSFPNEICEEQVRIIIDNFDRDYWLPITLDSKNFLLDGQHRLEAARRMRLKYIDAVVQNTELLNGKN